MRPEPGKRKAERAALLERLAERLRVSALTAREMATEIGISRFTAYIWLHRLIDRGEPVYQIKRRDRRVTGPVPIAYGIQA